MSASTPDSHDPRPAAVSFVTTEHFTLQGARAATIAESTGRATMFLGAVSGGLIALGLLPPASALPPVRTDPPPDARVRRPRDIPPRLSIRAGGRGLRRPDSEVARLLF